MTPNYLSVETAKSFVRAVARVFLLFGNVSFEIVSRALKIPSLASFAGLPTGRNHLPLKHAIDLYYRALKFPIDSSI